MTQTSAAPAASFIVPAWWQDPAFSMREIAAFLDLPHSTANHWFEVARIAGKPLGSKRGSRRFYTCHDLYFGALLAKLNAAGFAVNDAAITAAHDFIHNEHGQPVAPAYNGVWRFERPGAGAYAEVQAWLAWTAVRAYATPLFGGAHV